MINSEPKMTVAEQAAREEEVRRIVGSGAGGAVALAGITTAIVLAIWFAFYLFVFVPRATP
jgi:hypothetical protein